MSDLFKELLEATIHHVEDLKARGVNYAPLDPKTLEALGPLPSIGARTKIGFAAKAPSAPVASKATSTPAPIPSVQRPLTTPAAIATPTPLAPEKLGVPASSPPPSPAQSPAGESKLDQFKRLRERVLACKKCGNLVAARKNVVFGVGNLYADLMFVGEAPGADEDAQGEPFVGAAGQLLTKIIQAMGLRREDVYIANILKCRPDTPGQRSGNRKPTPDEMATCMPHLQEQIDLVRPKVLVALGATAIEGLLGPTVGITKLRGNWQTYRNLPLMPTYHPAFLLRNQTNETKRLVWEDMLKVMEKLGMRISERQRAYFT